MIIFDLKCHQGHGFECWFRDSASFDEQLAAGDVLCPRCGSDDVSKALMAPNISTARGRGHALIEGPRESEAADASSSPATLAEQCNLVEENCDYVGTEFPEEARKIHYGETKARNIYGEASLVDAHELWEEGIEFAILPGTRRYDA